MAMVDDGGYVVQILREAAGLESLAAQARCEAEQQREHHMKRPSTLYMPRLYIDGNKWCALYGLNIHDGVAGFGDSPSEAMADFDRVWVKKI